ncbi:oxidoreductase [Purpureocillium lavendulum]|uniref:Oxidoreductase n=1 Tax=Purpureocillium lavendulum TaxID=1247861 RepID=A0AB34FTM1_9HYPO|nr:oxidoreductase [Purpureocillium lavendulum]
MTLRLLGPRILHRAGVLRRVSRDEVGEAIALVGASLRVGVGAGALLTGLGGGVVAPAEALAEGGQLAGLVELDVAERLLRGLPEQRVARVLGGAVEGQRRGAAHRVRGAVGQLHELREGVGPARARYKGRVPHLRGDDGSGRAERGAGGVSGGCCDGGASGGGAINSINARLYAVTPQQLRLLLHNEPTSAMKTCRAMRNASLAARGLRANPGRLVAAGPSSASTIQARTLSLQSVAKGVHDGVMGALEIGAWLTGRKPLQYASTSQRISPSQVRSQSHHHHRHPSFHVSPPSPPTADPEAETSLPEQLRSVMRLLANPVVVCTSTHGATPRAMTMSSFTSLTLAPTPLVTFNVATPSRTLDAIAASGHFNIHVLAGDAAGAAVADHFTRGNVDGVFDDLEGADVASVAGLPVLRGEGVLRVLRCRVLKDGPDGGLLRVRDHVIVVGEVVDMIPGKKSDEFGLAYADRKYRLVGGVIARD